MEAHRGFFAENPDLMRIFHQVRGMLKSNGGQWRPLREILAAHIDRLGERLCRVELGERMGADARCDLAILLFLPISGTISVLVSLEPKATLGTPPPELTHSCIAMAPAFASRAKRARNHGRHP